MKISWIRGIDTIDGLLKVFSGGRISSASSKIMGYWMYYNCDGCVIYGCRARDASFNISAAARMASICVSVMELLLDASCLNC